MHEHRHTPVITAARRSTPAKSVGSGALATSGGHDPRAAFGRPALPARASGSEEGGKSGPEDGGTNNPTFRADLIALIPNLRAFGITLAGRKDGEDLAQETLAKAWHNRARYEPGTNLKAWAFTILRNHFYSGKRRDWRTQPLDPGVAESVLIAHDNPSSREELVDVRNAMQQLADDQREALILVGPAGLSYEETAEICGCAIGTVKSRVSRARAALNEILAGMENRRRERSSVSAGQAFDNIMQQATDLQRKPRAG